MDITVSVRAGWALLTDTNTGKTAVCIPEVLPDRMTFHLKGWHDSYDDAFLVVAAMDALGFSITDFDTGGSNEEVDQEPPQIEATVASRIVARITAVAHRSRRQATQPAV